MIPLSGFWGGQQRKTRRVEELGRICLHVLPVAAWKRFKAFVLESSAEEWTESLGTSATAARGHIQSSKQLRVGRATSQKVLRGKTPYSSYLTPTQHSLKSSNNTRLHETSCFNIMSTAKRLAPEKIWPIPLAQIILSKKQQDLWLFIRSLSPRRPLEKLNKN